MKPDELLEAIGGTKDEYVRDAECARRKSYSAPWVRWAAMAACLVLVIGGGLALLSRIGGKGGNSGDSSDGSDGMTYMSYAGPVFPLTVQGESDGITARRDILFDFSPYNTVIEEYLPGEHKGEHKTYRRYDNESRITDSYVLMNAAGTDKTITALYPYSGTYSGRSSAPVVTVDGAVVETKAWYGPYAGGFKGAIGGADEETGSVNFKNIDSFEGYEALLSDGSYLRSAFDEFPALETPVIVYRLSDFVFTEDETAPAPTLQMDFQIDYSKTYVFSYGMNGGTNDSDTGYCARRKSGIEYRPNVSERYQYPDDGYVILAGEDLEDYTIQGYRDGGCDEGEELNDLSCSVTRYESTLGEVLREIAEKHYCELNDEIYLNLLSELLVTHGPLSGNGAQRYDFGFLEDVFSSAATQNRVIYLAFEITVPAGESVTVKAEMTKEGSFNYYGEGMHRDGYETATVLGSNLTFEGQAASIMNFEQIEILKQNFGFDPANGITEVSLDLNVGCYWMQVKKIYTEE